MSTQSMNDTAWALPPQRSLPEIVAERVVEAIRLGELKPGERIVEIQLAKKLGVSRGPLREALKMLEAAHIVASQRARGTFVADISSQDILQMMVVRATLEGMAARLVAGNRTPDVLAPIEDILNRLDEAARAGHADEMRVLDWLFHETVCRQANNTFLLNGWSAISNLIRVFLREHTGFERDRETVLSNHRKMFKALASGTPDEAEQTFRNSILRSSRSKLEVPLPDGLLAE